MSTREGRLRRPRRLSPLLRKRAGDHGVTMSGLGQQQHHHHRLSPPWPRRAPQRPQRAPASAVTYHIPGQQRELRISACPATTAAAACGTGWAGCLTPRSFLRQRTWPGGRIPACRVPRARLLSAVVCDLLPPHLPSTRPTGGALLYKCPKVSASHRTRGARLLDGPKVTFRMSAGGVAV